MTKRLLLAACLLALSLPAAEVKRAGPVDMDEKTGSARAVIVDPAPLAHTTQFLPLNAKAEVIGAGNVDAQLEAVMALVATALQDGGSDLQHIVKLNVYAANDDAVAATQKFLSNALKHVAKPAVTYVVGKLAAPGALVAMDAIGIAKRPAKETTVRRVHSDKIATDKSFADVAVLPKGGVVYISGQAQKGELAEATTKTLEQLEQTLKFLTLEKRDVVSAKAFVQPATDAAIVRAQFAKFFKGELVPPLSLVDWSSGKDTPIEIEMVVSAQGTGSKETNRVSYLCPPFMTGSPVYSKVARVNSGRLIYLSGLTGKSPNSAEAEIHEIFADMKDVLEKTGSDLGHLVKATYYVSNPQTSDQLNKIRPKYYNPKTAPAASKAMVKSVGFPGKGITIDMIAVTAE